MKILSLFIIFFVQVSLAEPVFISTRIDENVPEKCRDFKLAAFDVEHDKVFYSIRGGIDKGFTNEYPMTREEARRLWEPLKSEISYNPFRKGQNLWALFEILSTKGYVMGFSFKNEGEILEALALIDLQNDYSTNQYFHTGGIEYRDGGSNNVIGELDVLVGRKRDCKIVVIGETKLGIHSLGKAKQQIRRFENFLDHFLSR